MEALLKLKSVLCDPEGLVCVAGSEADREIIQSALAELAAELAAATAEIERLTAYNETRTAEGLAATQRLAAEQAKNMGLWEALENLVKASAVCLCHFETDHTAATEALSAITFGTSALESYVTKAGEKMREKCSSICKEEATDAFADGESDDWGRAAVMCSELISSIPGVALEDLE